MNCQAAVTINRLKRHNNWWNSEQQKILMDYCHLIGDQAIKVSVQTLEGQTLQIIASPSSTPKQILYDSYNWYTRDLCSSGQPIEITPPLGTGLAWKGGDLLDEVPLLMQGINAVRCSLHVVEHHRS